MVIYYTNHLKIHGYSEKSQWQKFILFNFFFKFKYLGATNFIIITILKFYKIKNY
jgi:hypothetical protein